MSNYAQADNGAVDMTKDRGPSGSKERRNIYVESGDYDARFVGYVELGIQPQRVFTGDTKKKDPCPHAMLSWELVNERFDFGGELGEQPIIHSEVLPVFLGDRAKFKRIFLSMSSCAGAEGMTNFLDMADAQIPCIFGVRTKAGKKKIGDEMRDWFYMNMDSPESIKRAAESKRDPKTKKMVDVDFEVEPASKQYINFAWNAPTLEAFNELPAWIQKKIMAAGNFSGSPIEALLIAAGRNPEEEQKTAQQRRHEASAPPEPADYSDDDYGPAFPSEASGLDDIPF